MALVRCPCGTDFTPKRPNGRPQKWCTKTCPKLRLYLAARSKAWRAKNTERHRAYNRAYCIANPDVLRKRELKKKFGLTPADYDAMLAKQGGRCAICRTSRPSARRRTFDVDHCHATGRIRGLLCEICNRVLGMMKDNAGNLRAAADYLSQ